MMNKATIYDFARMCKSYIGGCKGCPLYSFNDEITGRCRETLQTYPGKANEIILKWCKEHPVETRQDRVLKMFSNAKIDVDGALGICPQCVNKDFSCQTEKSCIDCCKEYWLAEVEESE